MTGLSMQNPLQSLIIGHTFLVLLLPLLGALFYYSTPHSRRQPIFILNVLSLTLAFIGGVLSDVMNMRAILSPEFTVSAQIQIAGGCITLLQGMLVDCILLVRLITVHPLSRIGPVRFALLTSLPIALKVARMVNAILYINQLCIIAEKPDGFEEIYIVWLTMPYMKIEWVAQMVDNSYASVAFLWTIWNSRTNMTSGGLLSVLTLRQYASMSERIRTLFRLALSNFLIPTLITIVELFLLFRVDGVDPTVLNAMILVNPTVSAFGVVFATIWAGKEQRREREAEVNPNSFPAEYEGERVKLQCVRTQESGGRTTTATATPTTTITRAGDSNPPSAADNFVNVV